MDIVPVSSQCGGGNPTLPPLSGVVGVVGVVVGARANEVIIKGCKKLDKLWRTKIKKDKSRMQKFNNKSNL